MMDYKKLPLWPHQFQAIEDSRKYLSSAGTTFNYLVKMPTGSGKTGIMAVLSRILFDKKNFLIVVPSIALKEQLIKQIDKDFWEDKRKMNIKGADLTPKEVLDLLPSTLPGIITNFDKKKHYILICVVNTLDTVKKDNVPYSFLKKSIDFIFFDEGHKEPAFSWAKAVRELGKKTILFSATPYRNDLKLFNIDKTNYHFLTHQQAVNNNLIRDVEFRKLKGKSTNLPVQFKTLIGQLQSSCAQLKSKGLSPKVIFRCKGHKRTESVVNALKTLGVNVLGLHDNFQHPTSYKRKNVPDEDGVNAFDMVVHENKLIEGVDNPNFLVLVVVDEFENERALFQQVGRITRNLNQSKNANAIVYYWEDSVRVSLETIWKKFISYDAALKTNGLYDASDIIQINEKIKLLYIKNSIRDVKQIGELNIGEVLVPKRTVIRQFFKKEDVSVDQLSVIIAEDLAKNDEQVEADFKLDKEGYCIIYRAISMSPYFYSTAILNTHCEIIVFYKIKNLIYFMNTSGRMPEFLLLSTRAIEPNKLLHMAQGSRRLSNISLVNSDLGKSAIRRRNFSAFSLRDVAPLLNDHNYIPSSVSAITQGFSDSVYLQRYLGIKHGKVSEYADEYFSIQEYKKWILAIDEFIKKPTRVHNYFKRYATKIHPPGDCTPVNILLELVADDNEFHYIKGIDFEWCDVASVVNAKGEFAITIETGEGKVQYDATVEYDPEKRKYWIKCEKLEEDFTSAEGENGIVAYLNQHQAFRIVTKNNSAFYVFGSFYEPRINLLGKNKDLDLLKLLIPVKDLAKIDSEKGSKALKVSGGLWHRDTLFGLIAREGVGYSDSSLLKKYFDFTDMACDDLNTEIADFIGLDSGKKRVVVIHAKAKTAVLSASSFQDVCGQATKKLDLLSPFFEKKPEINIKRFDESWKHKNIGTVKKRILKGALDGKGFWNEFERLIGDPDTKKEVYLFTGSMLDKSELTAQLGQSDISKVDAVSIDLIYLLRSTWSSVSALGANLKVFCY